MWYIDNNIVKAVSYVNSKEIKKNFTIYETYKKALEVLRSKKSKNIH